MQKIFAVVHELRKWEVFENLCLFSRFDERNLCPSSGAVAPQDRRFWVILVEKMAVKLHTKNFCGSIKISEMGDKKEKSAA